jgi:predicted deacylase
MRWIKAIVGFGLLVGGLATVPAEASGGRAAAPGAAGSADEGGLEVYTAELDVDAFGALREAGVDVHEMADPAGPGTGVEVVLSADQARDLAGEGVALEPKLVDATRGDGVFRPYGGAGGLKQELTRLAARHPGIAELVTVGRTVRGQDIVALKVTRHARSLRDGRRPAVLYMGGQHAREWITPETVRRLAHQVVDGYGNDRALTELVDTTELWFLPVANPDGYDYTFTPGHRNWRKNLRDNDGDGRITPGDGVDLNRNFPTKWFYDDEGSSSAPGGESYRGTAPASEPETRALDRLMDRVGFELMLNYHSASERLLYGEGWQVVTPTPDDVVYEALVGDDTASAVPGYDPDPWTDLYTANGETTDHAHRVYGTLGVTPEMSTCATASATDPADRWAPADCASAFAFPDDEALIAAEVGKNVPFALAVARSAADPGHPVSVTGKTTPEFVVDSFDVSYGDPQTVAVTARRGQPDRRLAYRIDGGPVRRARLHEWQGGERYGGEGDRYYAELRGQVTGTTAGDEVEVWFTAGHGARAVESEHFTYTVASDTGADALIVASEDYTGVNPVYPAGTSAPKYVDEYAAALDANGVSHATWDVDAQGVPHPLGVLSHFDSVVWETGDDRLVQDPEDGLTSTFLFGPLPDIAVAERQQYLTMAMRDHLNEGGKLVQAGENAQYAGLLGRSLGGVYYGLDDAPDQDCVISRDFLADCLLLTDDFAQYYLGASVRASFSSPTGIAGRRGGAFDGVSATFGGQAVVDNPLDEAGAFSLTSDVLPADRFPLFAGEALSSYRGARNADPFRPVEGARYAGALAAPVSYQRLGRTYDLTGVSAAAAPRLAMKLSYSTLVSFHHVIVEAAPAGTDQWTTLPDLNRHTSTAPPTVCEEGVLLDLHPWLRHYLTPGGGGAPCGRTGTTGAWNSFTGESGGWVDVAFDLSAYAGQRVDLKVGYVTDPIEAGVAGGVGVFVDDTRLTADGRVVDADGFETDGGPWTVEGPPPGSPPANQGDFRISTALVDLAAAVATDDTVLLGHGLEALAAPAERADVLGRILDRLHESRGR